jgi:YCII-related domain
MTTFLLSYRNANNYTPGEPEGIAAWQAFFKALGESVEDIGNPIFARTTLGNCDADTTVLGGYSFISADDLDAAVQLAKGCPALANAGGVEIGEITPLNPQTIAASSVGAASAD